MENSLKELNALVAKKESIGEYLTRIESLCLMGESAGIYNDKNGRYSLKGVSYAIGEEKFESILRQFEGLLKVELFNVKEQIDKDLSKFKITVDGRYPSETTR